jgi:hypothetical protein
MPMKIRATLGQPAFDIVGPVPNGAKNPDGVAPYPIFDRT